MWTLESKKEERARQEKDLTAVEEVKFLLFVNVKRDWPLSALFKELYDIKTCRAWR